MIADFWYTAWVDGGKPDLRDLLSQEFSSTAKKTLKGEVKAYRRNELLQKNLLISKRTAVVDPASR
jgi:hypothetical protein